MIEPTNEELDQREVEWEFLQKPISRMNLIEAIEKVASHYGASGNHDSDLICDAFRELASELTP